MISNKMIKFPSRLLFLLPRTVATRYQSNQTRKETINSTFPFRDLTCESGDSVGSERVARDLFLDETDDLHLGQFLGAAQVCKQKTHTNSRTSVTIKRRPFK